MRKKQRTKIYDSLSWLQGHDPVDRDDEVKFLFFSYGLCTDILVLFENESRF